MRSGPAGPAGRAGLPARHVHPTKLRAFVDTNPQFEDAIDRLATYLARDDEADD